MFSPPQILLYFCILALDKTHIEDYTSNLEQIMRGQGLQRTIVYNCTQQMRIYVHSRWVDLPL